MNTNEIDMTRLDEAVQDALLWVASDMSAPEVLGNLRSAADSLESTDEVAETVQQIRTVAAKNDHPYAVAKELIPLVRKLESAIDADDERERQHTKTFIERVDGYIRAGEQRESQHDLSADTSPRIMDDVEVDAMARLLIGMGSAPSANRE